jgi:hypothetical protein
VCAVGWAGPSLFTRDCLAMDDAFVSTLGNRFQAIYMDPPLLRPGQPPTPHYISLADLVRRTPSQAHAHTE